MLKFSQVHKPWVLTGVSVMVLVSALLVTVVNNQSQDNRSRADTIVSTPGTYGYGGYSEGGPSSCASVTPASCNSVTPTVTPTPTPTAISTPIPTATPTPTPTPTPAQAPTSTNLSLFKPATAGSTYSKSYPASKAVDGSSTRYSYWRSKSTGWWLQIDLGSNRNLTKFIIKHAGTTYSSWSKYNTKAYNIQVSSNGTSWTQVASASNNTSSTTTHAITTTTARYVRLNIITPSNNGSPYARIPELEAYGY